MQMWLDWISWSLSFIDLHFGFQSQFLIQKTQQGPLLGMDRKIGNKKGPKNTLGIDKE